jgi:GxxExxY protein
MDLLVEDKVVVELKRVEQSNDSASGTAYFLSEAKRQARGLLINFHVVHLRWHQAFYKWQEFVV